MLNQSFRQVFVTNSSGLLAQGSTVEDLAVGQIGIIDQKTHTAVTAPTYAQNKAVTFVQGTPDTSDLPLMFGPGNDIIRSKIVKGKDIIGWRGKAAALPQNQIITIGWSGDEADEDTLFANVGDIKTIFLKLSGPAIDKLFSRQGNLRQYEVDTRCLSASGECAVGCEAVDPRYLATEFVKQINADPQMNRFIRASVVSTPSEEIVTEECFQFQVAFCDGGDDASLGLVQAQYPGVKVTRVSRSGSTSTYQLVKDTDTLPAAVSNAGITLIPECDVCPAGYTLSPDGFGYSVARQDAGDAGALTTLKSNYAIVDASGETAIRVNYQFGQSTYVIVSNVEISAPVGQDILTSLGDTRNTCILTSPTTYAWTLTDTLLRYPKVFRLTIGDDPCGTNRLTEIQAAFPELTVSIVDADGECVHTYETTVYSNCVAQACSLDQLFWDIPAPFLGSQWFEYIDADADPAVKAGIKIEVAYVNRITGECTFGYFPYEADTIHLQASSFNPDYNSSPCATDFRVKQIQQFKHQVGFGAYVREQEKWSKGYERRDWSMNPVLREIQGYQFIADPLAYYDQYSLEFKFSYMVGGWSERYTDTYTLQFFFPAGRGKTFETAINGYITSAAISLDPVVL